MKTDEKINLLPFLEIKKGEFFLGNLVVFMETLIINLQESGIKVIEPKSVTRSPKNNNSDMYTFFISTIGTPRNKRLSIAVKRFNCEIEYGTFMLKENEINWQKISIGDYMPSEKFNEIFPNIVKDLI